MHIRADDMAPRYDCHTLPTLEKRTQAVKTEDLRHLP